MCTADTFSLQLIKFINAKLGKNIVTFCFDHSKIVMPIAWAVNQPIFDGLVKKVDALIFNGKKVRDTCNSFS